MGESGLPSWTKHVFLLLQLCGDLECDSLHTEVGTPQLQIWFLFTRSSRLWAGDNVPAAPLVLLK